MFWIWAFNSTVICKKNAHIKFSSNDECYSLSCKEGFCKNNPPGDPEANKKVTLIIYIVVFIPVFILALVIIYFIFYKN